jgi:hypothetical protein
MFQIDTTELKKLEKDLNTLKKQALPYATRETLNSMAFAAQKTARLNIRANMVERNKFTQQSIRVERAQGLNMRRQFSVMGSTAPYMEDQEFGGIKRKRGKTGVSISTPYASSEGDWARPRKRLIKTRNRLTNIKFGRKRQRPKGQPKHRKQALLFKVQDSVISGKRTFFHDFGAGKKSGIYRVLGGRKGFKRGWPKGASLKMVYDMSKQAVSIPKNPTVVPAAIATGPKIPQFYKKALTYQLQRHGILS